MSTAALYRRAMMTFGLGKVTLTDDRGVTQKHQVQMSMIELRDLPVIGMFGFTSNPPIGADVLVAALGGDRGKGVVIGSSSRFHRPKDIPRGAAGLYDTAGCRVTLPTDGTIVLLAPGETLRKLITEVFQELFNEHTHPTPAGTSGPPNQKMTDVHLTGATRAGGP